MMSSFGSFFFSLDVLHGGVGNNVLHFFIKKNKFQLLKFYKLRSSNPWIRIQIRIKTNETTAFVFLILDGLQENNAGNIATLLYDAMGDVDHKSVGR
jgi:hypothetical protein